MIKLTRDTDSIFPYGLRETPFEAVYKAIQSVAGDVWDVDPTAYRAAIAWGYYLTHAPEVIVDCTAGREFIASVLVSEQAPLVKDTQTTEELVELLRLWRDYSPTFEKLEALYEPYAARVDIRPITDADSWQALPLDDTAGAFYVVIAELDWTRPLTLGEARTIALRATPMGSQPHAIFFFEEASRAYARPVFGDVSAYVIETELPAPPPPPATSLEVIVGIKWGGSDWIAPEFPANDWWYTGIRSDEDLVRIQAFGLETTTAAPNAGPWGNIKYSSEYEYEILALYADSNGTTPSQYTDLSNFEMDLHWYSYSATLLVIWNTNAISSGLITSYKLRITKKTTEV